MTSNEASSFPEIAKNGLASHRVFLNIRNRLLQMWIEDPKTQLTYENALKNIEKPFDSDASLVRKTHEFLERHGFINYGIFKRLKPIPTKKLGKVIIVGAGSLIIAIYDNVSVQFILIIFLLRNIWIGCCTAITTIWNGCYCIRSSR